jgi:tRNA-Thr(GGU) m(6)t(6)A37 methyltransferase TsaA
LLPGRHFEHALEDLAGWEYLWVLFWFDRNPGWRPKVRPPRGRRGRKGVFATRAPHRPNPLGLSAVRLLRVDGLTLHIAGVDMLDGTPVLDLKPYVPYTDAYPRARSGWLEGVATGDTPLDPVAPCRIEFSPLAAAQVAWIESETGLALRQRVTEALAFRPEPNAYRRIRRDAQGLRVAVKEWRVRFEVSGQTVTVLHIGSGYRAKEIRNAPADGPLSVHRAFLASFGNTAVVDAGERSES